MRHNQPSHISMHKYIGNGLIVDLMPYIDDGTLDVGQVSEAVLATGMADGVVYAISSGVNAPAVIYDKTLLDSVGRPWGERQIVPIGHERLHAAQ